MKIFIDPGHGGSDTGATGYGLREKDLTLSISKRIESILLNEYDNVQVKMSRTGDQTVSLNERTNAANAWNADFLLSVHINASGGSGFESYIYIGQFPSRAATDQKRKIIHDEVIKATGLIDRGKKEADFHMVRESHMQSVLTENGFIDNAHDANLLSQSSFLDKIARGHANGLEKALKLKKKASQSVAAVSSTSVVSSSNEKYKINKTLAGYSTAADAKAEVNKKTTVPKGEYFVYNRSQGMVNVTQVKGMPGSWINPNNNKGTNPQKSFLIKVKADELWYYNKPDWNARKGTAKKGEVFTVVDTLIVNGAKMYELKSGTYITANPQYVEKI